MTTTTRRFLALGAIALVAVLGISAFALALAPSEDDTTEASDEALLMEALQEDLWLTSDPSADPTPPADTDDTDMPPEDAPPEGVPPEDAPPGDAPPLQQLHERLRAQLRMLGEGDLDSDGIPNCEDADDDGDGINDTADEFPHDHDNDGIPDHRDDDDDNDGILDVDDDVYVGSIPDGLTVPPPGGNGSDADNGNGTDAPHQHPPRWRRAHRIMQRMVRRYAMGDLDSDGIPNCEDADDDGDGINDTADEGPADHDNDGIPDRRDDDDDNDGILDADDDAYVGNCTPLERRLERFRERRQNCDGGNDGSLGERIRQRIRQRLGNLRGFGNGQGHGHGHGPHGQGPQGQNGQGGPMGPGGNGNNGGSCNGGCGGQ